MSSLHDGGDDGRSNSFLQDDDEKHGRGASEVGTVVCFPTYHCIMSTSPVILVFFEVYNRYHDEIESADVNEDVHSLIKKVIKFLDPEKKKYVVPGNVDVYYQGSDVMSKKTVETLVGHWQKLSEFIKPGQQAAFFRMTRVNIPPSLAGSYGADPSHHFFQSFLSKPADIKQASDAKSISSMLQERVFDKIYLPLSRMHFPKIIEDPFCLVEVAEGSPEQCFSFLSSIVTLFLELPLNSSGSENDSAQLFHSFFVQLVWLFNSIESSKASWATNSTENVVGGTTIKKTRPDFLLWIKDCLMLKAEWKNSTGELSIAVTELTSKMAYWNPIAFRGMPFLPCYVIAGSCLQFHAIFPPQKHDKPVSGPISITFDLSVPVDRLRALGVTFNLFRIMKQLVSMCESPIPLYRKLHENSLGEHVVILDDHVEKCVRDIAPQKIYKLLGLSSHNNASKIRNTVTVYGIKTVGTFYVLKIKPFCLPRLPVDVTELRECIIDILHAVEDLHSRQVCHRDIRWPNVVYDVVGRCWRLIDFEISGSENTPLPENINPEHLPPENGNIDKKSRNKNYTSKGDIYSVGKLVRDFMDENYRLEDHKLIKNFVDVAMDENPLHRPPANELLAHSWITAKKQKNGK